MKLWPFGKRSLIDPETANWHVDNFRWLTTEFGEVTNLKNRDLVLPTPHAFKTAGKSGHELAEHVFEQVKQHAGLSDWHADVQAHDSVPDKYEGENIIRPVHERSAAGTFSVQSGNVVTITYSVSNLDRPHTLITVFAHELAHYLLATAPSLPVPPDETEFLTDLTAVFLGFGVFLSNDRFQYEQFQDGVMSGWQWRRLGYLPEDDLIFATALFLKSKRIAGTNAAKYLKSHLAKKLELAMRQIDELAPNGIYYPQP